MIPNKKAQLDFRFIARNPPALLIAGGILMLILGNDLLGIVLIILGFLLQVGWLYRFRL